MTDKQLLSLLRLVRFMISSSAMHDSIFKQVHVIRNELFCDEVEIDDLIERLEEEVN